MSGRARQPRRTPHSSSGNLAFLPQLPEGQYPQSDEYTQRHTHQSSPSLPSISSASTVRGASNDGIVKNLVDKMTMKLPCYSGFRLQEVEENESTLQIVEALRQLSRHCIDIIMLFLIQKYTGPEDTTLDIYESEMFVVRLIINLLLFHCNNFAEDNGSSSHEVEESISDLPSKTSDDSLRSKMAFHSLNPPPLEDTVAKYILRAMIDIIRRSGPTKVDSIKSNDRLESLDILHDLASLELDSSTNAGGHSLPIDSELGIPPAAPSASPFGAGAFDRQQNNRSTMSFSSERTVSPSVLPSVATFLPSAHEVRSSQSSTVKAPMFLTYLAGRVIYRLSFTNWDILFQRIRMKIHQLASNATDEALDITNLKLVTYCRVDKIRLKQVMVELSSLLVNMRTETQGAVAAVLRAVIWNWIEGFPEQFIEVVQSPRRRLEGNPERVFDLLYQLVDPGNKPMFWPTLSVLLTISPERLKAAEMALSKTNRFGKKHNNLLEQLHGALTTPSKLGDLSDLVIMCYNEICRAAFHFPSNATESIVLRSLAPDLADELKRRIINPPLPLRPFFDSIEPINVNLYADALVVILRYHPVIALNNVLPLCLEPDRSAAVKLCVVRALIIFISEAPKFRYQAPLDKTIHIYVAPKLREAMIDIIEPSGRMGSRPVSARDRDNAQSQPQDDRKELLLSIQTLWRVDTGFFFCAMNEQEILSFVKTSLKVLEPPRDELMQSSTLRTLGTVMIKMNNPDEEYTEEMQSFSYHAAPATMLAVAQQILKYPDDLEENKLCLNMILALLTPLANKATEPLGWKSNQTWGPSLAVANVALTISLCSQRMDISSLAVRGLRLGQIIARETDVPRSGYPSKERRISYLEVIGNTKFIILGRVEFQKKVRLALGPAAMECVTHLATWREAYYRWSSLCLIVLGSAPRSSTDVSSSSDGTAYASLRPEERQLVWENLTLLLAATAGACTSDESSLNVPTEFGVPLRHGISYERPSTLVKKFLIELVTTLASPWVPAQVIARDALGTELSPKWIPLLIELLDQHLQKEFKPIDTLTREHVKWTLIDQVILILRPIAERISSAEALLIKADIGSMLGLLSKALHQSQLRAAELRIKARFCSLLDLMLERRDIVRIQQENTVKNALLEVVIDWILESANEFQDEEVPRSEYSRARLDSNLAALKTSVNLSEDLKLRAMDDPNPSDSMSHGISRLFHRYFIIFIKAFRRSTEAYSTMEFDRVSQYEAYGSGKHEAFIQENVVSGIANLLQTNTDAGTKHVLSLAYSDDPRLRIIFTQIFHRVLSRGINFEDYKDGLHSSRRKSQLCEMIKGSEVIIQAVIEACPVSEIDVLVPVLLNLYDTRRSLMNLLKMVIYRQVDIMENPMDIFRANDICSRLLSGFARNHGYTYLRSIVKPIIDVMLDCPGGYELDPAKLPPGESQHENAHNLQQIAEAFLSAILGSLPALPPLIREVCRYIEEAISAVWPGARYEAIAAFLFLRFVVPAIVAPENIDIEIPPEQQAVMRRGLLLVAKIIQNLANNVSFGKEAHMTILNHFMQDGIFRITRFHSDLLKPNPDERSPKPDEPLGSSYDEADAVILHRFFQRYMDKIGRVLLGLSRMSNSHEDTAVSSGKRAWDDVCHLLVETNHAMSGPTLSDNPASQHAIFRALMVKHGHRNMDSVREIFQSAMASTVQRPTFVLTLRKINAETVDYDLLMCHVFKTVKERTAYQERFAVIVDCTGFTAKSDIPISWCKLFAEYAPSDLRQNFEDIYIVNPNIAARSFLRKIYYVFAEAKFVSNVTAVSSIADLTSHFHPGLGASLMYAMSLETEGSSVHRCQQHSRDQLRIPITMTIGESHIRLTSEKPQVMYPTLSCLTVEIIEFVDIKDIAAVNPRSDATEFLIRRLSNNGTLSFSAYDTNERERIVDSIRMAKNRMKLPMQPVMTERVGLSDISAALMIVGLFNISDSDESLRLSAYNLLTAVSSYIKYENSSLIPLRGNFIPTNTSAFLVPFSEQLSKFAPHLTLDLIVEFTVGFEKASIDQSEMCDMTHGKLKDCIHLLVEMTVKFPEVSVSLQRYIWTEMAKHENPLLNFALDDLIQTAIEGGLGSQRCELVGDALVAMTSINVRARVLKKLRNKASLKTTRSLTTSPLWNEISAIARLALITGYSPRLALQNQLFVPEIIHLTTLLCATGSLPMRLTVYGLAINLIQSLYTARVEDEGAASRLMSLLDRASQNDVLHFFGLHRGYPSSGITMNDYTTDQIPISALEGITALFIEALTHGAQSGGLMNIWRSRWMGLITSTAFQICPYIQYRAFAVLGLLSTSGVLDIDDDLFYQIIVAFKTALLSSEDQDAAAVMSMLRCIARVIPGLGEDSRYSPHLFWLAVALLQSSYLPLYEEAARLLEVTLETLARQGYFEGCRMSSVLLDARVPLLDITTQLDGMMGLSFDTAFSFSLAAIIFRGVRPPSLQPIARKLLRTVLRISAEAAASYKASHKENGASSALTPLDPDIIGYFLALLPFSHTQASYRELLRDAGVSSQWYPSSLCDQDGEEVASVPTVGTELFGISPDDTTTPLLVTSFVFAMLDSYQGSEQEKGFLFNVLAQLAVVYPDISSRAVVHYLSDPRFEWLLNSFTDTFTASPDTASSVQALFRITMSSQAWKAIAEPTITMTPSDEKVKTPHYHALEELDMHSLSAYWQFLNKVEAWKILKWIPQLVDVIID
ncbi:hypothetical protein BU17DRAFT_84597 [Hysterangium stoloniferum]|nr:hypothetical protein BU17DRAFT_84597 [Hysterangium stoloniferum]